MIFWAVSLKTANLLAVKHTVNWQEVHRVEERENGLTVGRGQ